MEHGKTGRDAMTDSKDAKYLAERWDVSDNFRAVFDRWRQAGLSRRAASALADFGIATPQELAAESKTSLLTIPNIGPRTAAEIATLFPLAPSGDRSGDEAVTDLLCHRLTLKLHHAPVGAGTG